MPIRYMRLVSAETASQKESCCQKANLRVFDLSDVCQGYRQFCEEEVRKVDKHLGARAFFHARDASSMSIKDSEE